MSGAVSSIHSGWRRAQTTSGVHRLSVYLQGSEYMRLEKDNHVLLNSVSDTKNVRINSRNYTQTSGDASGVQIKPNVSVTGTASITGLEISPRFAAGIAGTNLVGIKCDPLLKAGSGDIGGAVVGIQCNLDFGISGTRTITGDISAFEAFLAIPSTYTYSGDVSFMRVRDVNIKGWDYFLNVDSTGTGLTTDSDKDANSASHTLKCLVGSTLFHIQLYADS